MLKLYGGAFSRASIPQWYLEELNVPYEFVLLDMKAGQHREPEFLKINLFGKVPAIQDGDFTLYESGAILLYLAEKYGDLTDLTTRSVAAQWVLFANSTLATGIFVEVNREKETPRLLSPLNQMLKDQPFIMGDSFTVADVAVGSLLAYIPMMLKLGFEDYPAIAAYLARLEERPAFQKAILKR